jgi:hypothetical protein
MPLSAAQQAALARLQAFYEGDNPYNSVTNPGGFRQGGSLYNFVNALKDVAAVVSGAAVLVSEAVAASANSPKALRVDGTTGFTQIEKRQGRLNLGAGGLITGLSGATTLGLQHFNTEVYLVGDGYTVKAPSVNLSANSDGITFLNIGGGTITLSRADGDAAAFFYAGVNTPTISIGPGQSLRIISDTSNYVCAMRAIPPEFTLNANTLQAFTPAQRAVMRQSLKLAASGYVYVAANQTLTPDDVGKIYFLDTDRTITLPLYAACAVGDTFEFFVQAGTLTLTQPAGNTNGIGAPGYSGQTLTFGTGAYTVKKHDVIWRVYTSGVAKTGDVMTGPLTAPSISTSGASGSVNLTGRDGLTTTILYNVGRLFRIYDTSNQSDLMQVGQDGSIWTKQFGDLNTRIEARAKAYADNAQAASSGGVSRSGDIMTGALQVNGDFPQLRFQKADKSIGWGWLAHTDGKAYLQTYNSQGGYTGNMLVIGSDGSLATAQFGDLNTRIEQRAKAYADGAQAAAIASANSNTANVASTKFDKSGGRVNGDVEATGRVRVGVGQAASYLEMHDSDEGVRYIHCNSGFIGFLANDGNWSFRVTDGGAVWTRQFGDLNQRIEDRGSAYRADAVNQANNYTNGIGSAGDQGGTVVRRYGGGQIRAVDGQQTSWGMCMINNDSRIGRWQVQGGYLEIIVDGSYYGITINASDERMKMNIRPEVDRDELSKIDQIEFVQFDWRPEAMNSGHCDFGMIAQRLKAIEPRWVLENADTNMQLDLAGLLTSSLRANQQLHAKLQALTERVDRMEMGR